MFNYLLTQCKLKEHAFAYEIANMTNAKADIKSSYFAIKVEINNFPVPIHTLHHIVFKPFHITYTLFFIQAIPQEGCV